VHPGHEVGDAGIHPWVPWLRTLVAERHDAHLHPLPCGGEEQEGSPAVSLASVLAPLRVPSTQEYLSDGLQVGVVAVAVAPHRQLHLLQCGAFFSVVIRGAISQHSGVKALHVIEVRAGEGRRWKTDRRCEVVEDDLPIHSQKGHVIVETSGLEVGVTNYRSHSVSSGHHSVIVIAVEYVVVSQQNCELPWTECLPVGILGAMGSREDELGRHEAPPTPELRLGGAVQEDGRHPRPLAHGGAVAAHYTLLR